MKENTNKKPVKSSKKETEKINAKIAEHEIALSASNQDVKNAILTTSLLINLFFLTAWVAIQISTEYAQAIGNAISNI